MSVLPDPESDVGARVRERLGTEEVIWLTIVSPSGTPQPNPVWFVFERESESLLIVRFAGLGEFRTSSIGT